MIDVNSLIAELNDAIKKKYNSYVGVYFHGSRLLGKHKKDSDYDMVFIFNREINWKFKDEIFDIIYDFELKYEILIDARILNIEEIKTPNSFFKETVKKNGKFYAI